MNQLRGDRRRKGIGEAPHLISKGKKKKEKQGYTAPVAQGALANVVGLDTIDEHVRLCQPLFGVHLHKVAGPVWEGRKRRRERQTDRRIKRTKGVKGETTRKRGEQEAHTCTRTQ